MELISFIKLIETSLAVTNSNSVMQKYLGFYFRGAASVLSPEILASDKNLWLDQVKKEIIKGKADILTVMKKTIKDGKKHAKNKNLINYLEEKIYNHNEFDTDSMLYMAYSSRFEGLYFGFDYSKYNHKFSALEPIYVHKLINKQWYHESAKYLANQISLDLEPAYNL